MENKVVFIMLVGLPGSGKSTYATNPKFKDYKIHSSDKIREILFGDESIQGDTDLVFQTLHKAIIQDLKSGFSCIYDATNISYKRRRDFLKRIEKINCIKKCYLIATPYEECLKNNNKRSRKVPEDVIRKMYLRFDVPGYYEGWDDIFIYYADKTYENYYGTTETFISDYSDWDQDNPHHSATLGEHCKLCSEKLQFKYDHLTTAALLHDCGKIYTKAFLDSKGSSCEEAHYYNHERVGAYNSLFFEQNDSSVKQYVAILIRWHMQMYFIDKQPELDNKYKNLLGENLYSTLKILHAADKAAH